MTDTVGYELVPLPAELADCGCRGAPTRHATTCAAALAHAAIPLTQRAEYIEGAQQRFAAISWDYPTRINVSISLDISLDVDAYIAQHRDAYDRYELPAGEGWHWWEKPMQFISDRVAEEVGGLGGWFGHPRHVSQATASISDWVEYPRWGEQDTERFDPNPHDEQPPQVDPNQGDLFDNQGGSDGSV